MKKSFRTMYIKVTGTAIREMLGAVPLDPDLYQRFVLDKAQPDDDSLAAELKIAREELEAKSIEGVEQQGMTGFLRVNGVPHFSGHIIGGMFKEIMYSLRAQGCELADIPAYRKKIGLCTAVLEPLFPLVLPEFVKTPVWNFEYPNPKWVPMEDSDHWDEFHSKIMNGEELYISAEEMAEYERYIEHLENKTIRKIDGYKIKKAEMGVCTRPLRAETAQGPRVALAASETVPPGTTFSFHMVLMGEYADERILDHIFATLMIRGMAQWRGAGKGVAEVTYDVLSAPPNIEDIYWAEDVPVSMSVSSIVSRQVEALRLLNRKE